ncbi:NHL repeat containing protein [Candidatus Magnetobacterium bavaricum]|uniref:NHL repeat containing protein n=1 Tax=Candidatus Magnetobacterium bavaricum TaxID=29290 RepID=A0A0F3GHK9_9BACT|nr:NHL repeat containing protein [Candidatus Magnetobacterium bavaricum]
MALIVWIVALMSLVGSVAAQGKYVYKNMWPKLEQPWYFSFPGGIALDNSDNVYVADSGNDCIQKFTSDGKFYC